MISHLLKSTSQERGITEFPKHYMCKEHQQTENGAAQWHRREQDATPKLYKRTRQKLARDAAERPRATASGIYDYYIGSPTSILICVDNPSGLIVLLIKLRMIRMINTFYYLR